MKIHFVSGFLGSGKTTAIAAAAGLLSERKLKTGVVTNDQGKYLVDSKFMELSDIAGAEVKGGCFCCNYDQLDDRISSLIDSENPDVIFGESVGSCTDLMATVIKPMSRFRKEEIDKISFSNFVDSRMLLVHLKGEELPFLPETNYIWLKQIEESEILVINKIDLLKEEELEKIKSLSAEKYADKKLIFQNSHDLSSVEQWLKELDSFIPKREKRSIDVDYNIYGKGEANLAWLDEEIEFISNKNDAVNTALSFVEKVYSDAKSNWLPIGHLKFFLSTPAESLKISITTVIWNENWRETIKLKEADKVKLLVNARIQTSPEKLREIVSDAVKSFSSAGTLLLKEQNISYFQPGFPNPTHRFTE
ncbi:MAG TPA: GTP-binding protein [Ignavibacteriales bacterium]|nr:GTP-binding protein [Ignavibacteriales bacterium]